MDRTLQILVSVTAILYKYLLEGKTFQKQTWGWICMIICSAISLAYIYLFMPPETQRILLSLECAFFCLSVYGMYKHFNHNEKLSPVDITIIVIASIVIIYLVFQQLEEDTVWCQVAASAAFLSGQIFLAQKRRVYKITGWVLFGIGGICLLILYYQGKKYLICISHAVSVIICLYNIAKQVGWLPKINANLRKLKRLFS